MTIRDAIIWFRATFEKEFEISLQGTPFNAALLSAIAYQETGYIWQTLVQKGLPKDQVLKLCVGDTIDYDPVKKTGRKVFPRNKAALLAYPEGDKMFSIARQSLEKMAVHISGYTAVVKKPDKFVRGYGPFQYDLQFFETGDVDFFLKEQWSDATQCFTRFIKELYAAMERQGWKGKKSLTDEEKIYVAIAYNRGKADLSKGLKQGHQNDAGQFYGQLVSAYYDIARSIPAAAKPATGGGPAMNISHEAPFVPLATANPPPYPGNLIVRDSADKASVKLLQQRLAALGYTQRAVKDGKIEPLAADGIFGADTQTAVELFQARHTNVQGSPLRVDGQVGTDTWGALFGSLSVPTSDGAPSAEGLLAEVLDVASREVGTREDPPGSNSGKRVQEYQKSAGSSKGEAWCVSFVYWCFRTAAENLKVTNPMAEKCRTDGVLDLWNRAQSASKVKTLSTEEAKGDPSKIKPGMIFIISVGGGLGHAGFVSRVVGSQLETIEGNTNDGGSRQGIGVFRRAGRTIASINRGFIDFS